MKRWIGKVAILGSLATAFPMGMNALGNEVDRNGLLDEVAGLTRLVEGFYLHPKFVNEELYTWESVMGLQETWLLGRDFRELEEERLMEISQSLRAAIQGLTPATQSFGRILPNTINVNFRNAPSRSADTGRWPDGLAPGTILEVINTGVPGYNVVNTEGVGNPYWFEVRHNGLRGFVHSGYMQVESMSTQRLALLTAINRESLWIRSKIEGWSTLFTEETTTGLQDILDGAELLKPHNWSYNLGYEALGQIYQALNIQGIGLVTRERARLIEDITRLEQGIQANLDGIGAHDEADYTPESWAEMANSLEVARSQLVDGWQESMPDEELQEVMDSLRHGLRSIRRYIPEAAVAYSEESTPSPILFWLMAGGIPLLIAGIFIVARFLREKAYGKIQPR